MTTPMIKLIECPRDAMQGWKKPITTEKKVEYLNALLKVGFDTLDYGSFVSPKSIPQMADTKEVTRQLDLSRSHTKLLAIIANLRGAEDAVVYEQINYLGFPFSISETFQQRNTNSSISESLERVAEIQNLCIKTGKELVVYLSMGFGNPYGDPYSTDIAYEWAEKIAAMNVGIISLADTVGLATPELIGEVTKQLVHALPEVEIGVHLHASPAQRKEKLAAAFEAGCNRFDGALKGIGGCPMANDELVGNMDTVDMLSYFRQQNIQPDLDHTALIHALHIASQVFD